MLDITNKQKYNISDLIHGMIMIEEKLYYMLRGNINVDFK